MAGRAGLVGARIECRIRGVDDATVELAGRIDQAEMIGDGIVRIAGEFGAGHRFVLVTDDDAVGRWSIPG